MALCPAPATIADPLLLPPWFPVFGARTGGEPWASPDVFLVLRPSSLACCRSITAEHQEPLPPPGESKGKAGNRALLNLKELLNMGSQCTRRQVGRISEEQDSGVLEFYCYVQCSHIHNTIFFPLSLVYWKQESNNSFITHWFVETKQMWKQIENRRSIHWEIVQNSHLLQ